MASKLYDVVAVSLAPNQPIIRLIAQGKTLANAEAVSALAVIRRDVHKEFFVEVPEGTYKEGDIWKGRGDED